VTNYAFKTLGCLKNVEIYCRTVRDALAHLYHQLVVDQSHLNPNVDYKYVMFWVPEELALLPEFKSVFQALIPNTVLSLRCATLECDVPTFMRSSL
jgi:hypothetical protein